MDFIDWIKFEMDARGWKQADFARASKVSTAQVARVLTRQQGAGGNTFIEGVARAFKLEIDEVYRRYKNMPQINERSEKVKRIVSKVERVRDDKALDAINKVLDIYIPDDDGHDNKKVRNK